jgi:hypothetical protein
MQVRSQPHLELDASVRRMMLVCSVGLAAWAVAGALGVLSGYVALPPTATMELLLAVAVLISARRIYWQSCERRWRRLPHEARFGYANPLRGRSRSDEFIAIIEDDIEVEATTGSSHPRR